tara:strand:+ start:116 stop:298 length:183 start_codon:yes stop_codon:yes gene_type:complete
MINLEEHIIEIEGKKYVPLDIAQTAQTEGFNTSQLDEAMKLIKTSIKDINKSVNDSLKDD